ncbi:MAG: DNA glycosylase AlkZ-like family protein, partial [Acidimicrobiia bacterium]
MAWRTAPRTLVKASSRANERRDHVALSIVDARRIALAAQGFGREHRGATDLSRFSSVIDRVGVLQIDSVNVLVRSQELPIFARIGAHDRSVVAKAVARGKMFEYWVHEASLAPVELHPYMRWRMARPHPWLGNYYSRNRALVERLYRRVRDDGPLKAADVSMRVGKKGSWWDWDDAKSALEYLFYAGRLTTRARDNDFSRTYDLPERVLPARVLDARTPSELDARRALLMRAIDHTG